MEIQQHDSVVVEVAAISAGLRQAQREGEVVRGEREAPGTRVRLPSLPPPLYRPPGGCAGPGDGSPKGGGGQGGGVPPKASGAPPLSPSWPPPRWDLGAAATPRDGTIGGGAAPPPYI